MIFTCYEMEQLMHFLGHPVANLNIFMFSGTAAIIIVSDASFFIRGKVVFKSLQERSCAGKKRIENPM